MDDIEARIRQEYKNSGYTMGWRFLSSPAQTLKGAKVAFIGLNPGGSVDDESHGDFAMKAGQSAYRDESWAGCPKGESKLQKQVLALFERLGEKPENVLSGNLIPFRSPSWESLKNPKLAIEFGEDLWSMVLRHAKPSLVVTMGQPTKESVCRLLHVRDLQRISVGWGNIAANKGRFIGGTFVGLPHLSRFGIMNRPESAESLDKLFSN